MDEFDQKWESLLFFALLSCITLFLAYKKKYFSLPEEEEESSLKSWHALIGFLLYIVIALFLSKAILALLLTYKKNLSTIALFSYANFFTQAVLILVFIKYFSKLPLKTRLYIWKTGKNSYSFDILLGLLTWLIAFPIVVFSSEIFNLLIYLIFQVKKLPDQIAIQYVKLTLAQPHLFVMALISIIFFAPIIEEFLFRGLLQNLLKKWLGAKFAIFLGALLFACFHFSSSQGVANITVIGSLFILACFIGFVYERQRSLLSPIILHATFNGLSILNLILFNLNKPV